MSAPEVSVPPTPCFADILLGNRTFSDIRRDAALQMRESKANKVFLW